MATDHPEHKRKRPNSPFIYCHSLDCEHKYGWQCSPECHAPKTPCKKWWGSVSDTGYAVQKENGEYLYVHRVRWEKVNGPIPEGRKLMNTCGMTRCVNPQHWRLSREMPYLER